MIVRRSAPAAALAAVLLGACAGGAGPADGGPGVDLGAPPALSTLAPGDPVEPVVLDVLAAQDAGSIDFSDLGGPAVINFWATWCEFCLEEMPDLEQVHLELGDQVRFIGVDREDGVQAALDFVAEVGTTYEMVVDPDGSFFRASKGRGMPTTLFVDADGIIRYRHAGPMQASQLRSLLAEHLGIGTA